MYRHHIILVWLRTYRLQVQHHLQIEKNDLLQTIRPGNSPAPWRSKLPKVTAGHREQTKVDFRVPERNQEVQNSPKRVPERNQEVQNFPKRVPERNQERNQ